MALPITLALMPPIIRGKYLTGLLRTFKIRCILSGKFMAKTGMADLEACDSYELSPEDKRMRNALVRVAAIVIAVMALNLAPASAQFNPIQAAKDAYNKTKAEQQAQQQGQQQQGQQQPQAQQTQIASTASPAAPQPQTQSAISLDVVGIKPGMAQDAAMQALKADNPKLKMSNTSIQAEGFASPLIPLVQGDDIAPNNVAAVNQPTESIQVLFTTPPGQSVVWSVWRNYLFPTSQRPSMQAVLDALVKKYGQPSTAIDPNSTVQTISWVYDAQGNPMGPTGKQVDTICGGTLPVYNGGNANQALHSDFASPTTARAWPPQCTSSIIISASVSGARVSSTTIACNGMEVHLWDGGRYTKSRDATLSVMAAAIKARQNGTANQVKSVPVPKL